MNATHYSNFMSWLWLLVDNETISDIDFDFTISSSRVNHWPTLPILGPKHHYLHGSTCTCYDWMQLRNVYNLFRPTTKIVSVHQFTHILFGFSEFPVWADGNENNLQLVQRVFLPQILQNPKLIYRLQSWLQVFGWDHRFLDFRGPQTTFKQLQPAFKAVTLALRKYYNEARTNLILLYGTRLTDPGLLDSILVFL